MAEPLLASSSEFRPHLFGKFFVLQRLAAGGMAEVYRAKVLGAGGFEKELALKRILAYRSQDDSFIKMLVNEAKLTAQLTHSNIVQIYECGAVDGTYFIAMELVHGVSMKEMVTAFARTETRLTPEQAIFIVLQLLQGLDYAHRKTDASGQPLNVVHCDVSPDNALVSWEGEVKLLDFGIARASAGLSNYRDGMLMGKLGYVAPEQASVEKSWDHRVDLFATGIVLYELLTGQKPFPKATDVDSLVASRKVKPAPPSTLDSRIPRELDAIVAPAIAYDPDRRYASARAFANALVEILFPTPVSSVQDLLSQQVAAAFADRITRQRAARSHDPLVMKVLLHLAEKQQAERSVVAHDEALAEPEPPVITTLADTSAAPPAPAPTRAGPSRGHAGTSGHRVSLGAATFAVLVVASLAAAGAWWAAATMTPGVLVVTSDPAGAQVSVNGRTFEQTTPAVIEAFPSSQTLSVTVTAPDHKPLTVPVDGSFHRLVRRVSVDLPDAIGKLEIVSEPAGARVRFDGAVVGVTPVTLPRVRTDERHRIALELPGYELDEAIVLPEVDGPRVSRKLVRPEKQVPGLDLSERR